MEEPIVRIEDVVMVAVSKLVPHPKNPNIHTPEQIKSLSEIIEFQGWRYPIKVSNQTGFITSGHGRVLAAQYKGWESVPVSYQDYESEAQEYADIVSDNAIADWATLDLSKINNDLPDLGPDFDIDLLGIKDFLLEPAEKLEPRCDEDEVPEHVEPKTKLGDIYQLGRHRLMCGDSTSIDAVESLMDGENVELCFTSPPYADQREYNGGKELSTEHLATFIRAGYSFVSYFAVNLGYSRKDGEVSPYWDDYISEAKNCGLKFLSWNIWDKGECGSIGNQTAMFPVEFPETYIEAMTDSGDGVYEPFGGSGSTLIACEKTNRKCFMMELDPHYCDVIVARWEKYTGKKAELLTQDQSPGESIV